MGYSLQGDKLHMVDSMEDQTNRVTYVFFSFPIKIVQLARNANPSLASPYISQRLTSLCVGNDVIGIDLGTTNSCVVVMEGKVDNKVWKKMQRLLMLCDLLLYIH